MAEAILDIVNENDEVIGSAPRSQIHKEGLLHREIHVWFITPDGNVVLQRRSTTKDTYPNLLDVAVGGHVELGASYEESALTEIHEEAGIIVSMSDLHLLTKRQSRSFDEVTGMTNNVFRHIYGYLYRDNVSDLQIEESDGAGFEVYPLDSLFNPTEDMYKNVIPGILDVKNHDILQALKKLIA